MVSCPGNSIRPYIDKRKGVLPVSVLEIYWIVVAFVYGVLAGSYVNMLTYRLKRGIPLFNPTRSICDYCGKTLGVLDLVPVLSYIYRRGKSKCCDRELSPAYPVVELIVGLAFGAVAWMVA